MSEGERKIVDAVMYAVRSGCFFPVPEPKPPYRVRSLIRWGAMRDLHDAIAVYGRELDAPRAADAVGQRRESRPDVHAR